MSTRYLVPTIRQNTRTQKSDKPRLQCHNSTQKHFHLVVMTVRAYCSTTIWRQRCSHTKELSWKEWIGIAAIAWNKITCSRGRAIDLDLKIPCHMDGSMSGYFLMIDDMSLNYGSAMKSQCEAALRGRRTLWRLEKMTFRELTELQEKPRNGAHTSAIMHMVETNGWSQLDRGRKWIAAGDGSRPGVVDWRWITRDGWQSVSFSIWRYGRYVKLYPFGITYFDIKLRSYNGAQICRYTMYCRRYRSSEYDAEHYSEIPNEASTCPSYNAEYNPEWDPDSASVILSHTATMPLPHIVKPYEISPWRSNDL